MVGDKALVLCQHGSQGTRLACSSRRHRGSPLYLGRAVPPGPQTRAEIAVLRRLGMFRTTTERQSCWVGAPTAMWHCVSRCAPRTSAGHALCLTMVVGARDNRAPHACST